MFVAQHLHAPRLRSLVDFADDLHVDVRALFKGLVELDLADLAAQIGLRKLRDRVVVVGDSVRGTLRIEDLEVQNAVDRDLHVVLRDANLLGHVDRALLQRMPVANAVEERPQDVKTRLQRAVVTAKPLHDPRLLLRNDARDARYHDHREDRDDDCYEKATHRRSPFSFNPSLE